ncbi:MAG: DUF4279 domain-containing protein [Chloroflexi bacterium]|nr:DUF4279 domain-containing protein [Chloroflexota bacterium]
MKETVIKFALNELKVRSFESTRQYFEEHELAIEASEPIIVYVDEDPVHNRYIVYFELKSVDYYLAIPVFQSEGILKLDLVYLQDKISVFFRVISDVLSPKDISKRLGLAPTRVRHKDELLKEGYEKRLPHHVWFYESEAGIPRDLNEKLANLLTILEPIQQKILELSSDAYITIWVDYRGNSDYLNGFSFDRELIQKIASLGCDFDIDMYVGSPRNMSKNPKSFNLPSSS